jgi:hypothetical protein
MLAAPEDEDEVVGIMSFASLSDSVASSGAHYIMPLLLKRFLKSGDYVVKTK